jgi:hypothetical protein
MSSATTVTTPNFERIAELAADIETLKDDSVYRRDLWNQLVVLTKSLQYRLDGPSQADLAITHSEGQR